MVGLVDGTVSMLLSSWRAISIKECLLTGDL